MNQHASGAPRVASAREVDCWENEGGAGRAPHRKDSGQTNQTREMRRAETQIPPSHHANNCRINALHCSRLAAEATLPQFKKQFMELAARWSRIATELERTKRVLEVWGAPISNMPWLDDRKGRLPAAVIH
jgi:hypothetical protein